MEMRSESGILSGREAFSVSVQKSSANSQQAMQNMQLIYGSDGTAIYKPLTSAPPPPPPYQGGGGPGGGGGGGGGGGAAAGDATSHAMPLHGLSIGMGEPVKRKRGRPRKYGPNGSMALSPTPVSSASPLPPVAGAGAFFPSPTGSTKPALSTPANSNKKMGRPLGSGKKQQVAALGSSGLGFTPHVITVNAGEDVSSKILSFSQHGPQAVCILSANGAISNVTLRQATSSGGTVTYEGRFEILSLSGSFLLSETGGHRSRTGGLSVSLAGPDGRVLGGGVAGLLTAASPVQVVVGSFIADGKKEPKHVPQIDPTSVPGKLGPGVLAGASSPPSRGTLSESSGSPGSPLNGAGINSSQQGLPTIPWK